MSILLISSVTDCIYYRLFLFILVDGGWDTWSEFSECSTTCGTGVQISTRTCTNPSPEHNGRDCEGEASSVKSCDNKDACAGKNCSS